MRTQKRRHHTFGLALVVFAACGPAERSERVVAPTPTQTVTTATPAPATAGPKLMPVDEASRDASLVAFRASVADIVRHRDRDALLAVVHPNIRTTFGDGGQTAGFRRDWKLDGPQSPVWAELEEILALGGQFQRGGGDSRFWAPYVYTAWPQDVDPFSHLAILGPAVVMRATSAADSREIATLAYDIVRAAPAKSANTPKAMRRITTLDGVTGWVRASDVRSPVDYRMAFVKQNGTWLIEALVVGD